MKKLLKIYGFNSDMQYFEMIVESMYNGQYTQAYNQFKTMPRKERITFLKSATVGDWKSGLTDKYLGNLFELI
jgi:uncharacterized membrane protein YbaN (DUF454 family)